FDGKTIFFSPIFPGRRVESTGAGDSFAAGVLAATIRGLPLKDGLAWGAVNSASVVGTIGPQEGLLSDREIKKRLSTHPKFKVKIFS
ncbi:MAG: PfkB family carbohydrate kinase, partial [bacterium]|nr:PfkB family carbohydrate kinase [bacterium]